MSWPSPLFGLLRRPSIVVFLAVLTVPLAVVFSLPVAPGKDLESEIAAGVAQVGMVAMVGALSGLVGMLWSLTRHDLWKSGLDWHLPGVRRWFLVEELLVATGVCAVAAAWIAVVHSHGSLPIQLVVAVSFALACFVAGGFESDPSTHGVFRFAGFLGWYVPLFKAAEVERVLLAMPPVTVISCLGAAALLWRRRLDRRVARRRPHDGLATAATGTADQWRKVKGPQGDWGTSLVSDQYPAWIRAALYECGGGRVGLLVGYVAFSALMIAVVLRYVGTNLVSIPILGMIVFVSTVFPFRLASRLLYPISRLQRGRLVAAGTLLNEVSLVGLSAVFMVLIMVSPLAHIWPAAVLHQTIPWSVALMVGFAWMPIASWASVRAATGAFRVERNALMVGLVPFLVYTVPVALTLSPFSAWWMGGERTLVFALVALIAVVCRVALWWATQRHFARADLAPVVSS